MNRMKQYKVLIHAVDLTRGEHNGAMNCRYLLKMIHKLGYKIVEKKNKS